MGGDNYPGTHHLDHKQINYLHGPALPPQQEAPPRSIWVGPVVGGARCWAGQELPVQALGGSPVESGASQQSHSLLPVQRVETTGPRVRGHRSEVTLVSGCGCFVPLLKEHQGVAPTFCSLAPPLSLPLSLSVPLALPPPLSSPPWLRLLTCVGGAGWASETSSWPCQSESCDWTSPGQALRGWSCGSLAHCGGSLDRK